MRPAISSDPNASRPQRVPLMVKVETSDQWVLFSGAKCNYRRVKVAV